MKEYQVTSYQVIYNDNSRDTVRLQYPAKVNNIEEYRKKIKREYKNCIGVNLNYTELQ